MDTGNEVGEILKKSKVHVTIIKIHLEGQDSMNASYNQLIKDLQRIGVCGGDLLVVHSSFKSLGCVQGGAECVITALKDAVGEDGTLIFPTFTYVPSYEDSYFSNLETPSCVGYLSEFFRKTDGVIRTNHPTHSVAIYGKLRDELGAESELDDTPMGIHSPYRKLSKYGGKILMLGCSLAHNSFMHAVEEVVQAPYALRGYQEYTIVDQFGTVSKRRIRRHNFTRPDGKHIYQRYDRTLDILDEADYTTAKILDANAVLIDSVALEAKAVRKLRQEPLFFIDDPHGLYDYLR